MRRVAIRLWNWISYGLHISKKKRVHTYKQLLSLANKEQTMQLDKNWRAQTLSGWTKPVNVSEDFFIIFFFYAQNNPKPKAHQPHQVAVLSPQLDKCV